jgi:hypothetical protein
MATPTYTPLYSTTLASATASVDIVGIPQIYRDLILVVTARSDSANAPYAQCRSQFNGDTGSNYSYVEMTGDGSSAGSYSATATEILVMATAPSSSASGTFNQANVHLMDFSATDKQKPVIARNDGAASNTRAQAARWANTAAITSLKLFPAPGYGNFATGSTFSLFGIASA